MVKILVFGIEEEVLEHRFSEWGMGVVTIGGWGESHDDGGLYEEELDSYSYVLNLRVGGEFGAGDMNFRG